MREKQTNKKKKKKTTMAIKTLTLYANGLLFIKKVKGNNS